MTIKTHTESSKSELSSGGKRLFKVRLRKIEFGPAIDPKTVTLHYSICLRPPGGYDNGFRPPHGGGDRICLAFAWWWRTKLLATKTPETR